MVNFDFSTPKVPRVASLPFFFVLVVVVKIKISSKILAGYCSRFGFIYIIIVLSKNGKIYYCQKAAGNLVYRGTSELHRATGRLKNRGDRAIYLFDGQCRRKQTAHKGKGEKVGQEPTACKVICTARRTPREARPSQLRCPRWSNP